MQTTKLFILVLAVLFLSSCKDNNNPVITPNQGDKPLVALVSPTTQTEILDSVYVEISASDNKGVTRVDFIVDNIIIKSWPVGPFKAIVDLSMFNDSSWHSAYAKVYDADSNFTTTPVITLTIRRLLAPENLWIESLTDKFVKLHWTDKSQIATGYQVEEALSGGTYNSLGITEAKDSLFVVNNLDTSKEYTFRVKPVRNNYAGVYTTTNTLDYTTWWDSLTILNSGNFYPICMLYLKNNDLIITGTTGGTIQINNYSAGKLVNILSAASYYVYGLDVSPDGNNLVSAGEYFLKIWSLSDFTTVKTISTTESYYSVSYSPDGNLLATISYNYVRIWDVSGTLLRTLGLSNSSYYSNHVLFSKDGTMVIYNDGNSIKFCRVSDGMLLKTITGTPAIGSLAISPDGLTIAAGGSNDMISIYDAGSGFLENTFFGHNSPVISLSFSNDSKYLLSSDSYGNMKLWDMNSLTCAYSPNGLATCLSFGKDNNSIISGGPTGIKIQNKITGWKTKL